MEAYNWINRVGSKDEECNVNPRFGVKNIDPVKIGIHMNH